MPTILGRRCSVPVQAVRAVELARPKTASRGYDNLWKKTSERYRRKHPFCVFCHQEGRIRLNDSVDHKIPIDDGGDRLKQENLQGLCDPHHNGLKRRLEVYARENGQIYLLPIWCDDPASRPTKFRGRAMSPSAEVRQQP